MNNTENKKYLIQSRSLVGEICSLFIFLNIFCAQGVANQDDGLVIIEKAPDIKYETRESEERYGSPSIRRITKEISIGSFSKDYTNVEDVEANIESSFKSLSFQYNYNFQYISLAAEAVLASGTKTQDIAGEDSSEGLQDSLKKQYLGELGVKLYLNFLSTIWIRPYAGIGTYKLGYDYDSNGDEETEKYNIGSSVTKFGVSILLGEIDKAAATNLWREFGISRVNLNIESKKYAPVSADNISKYQSSISLGFEF